MPEDNKDAYKEMYEMGERLMQMAKDGGYSPESGEEDSYPDESEMGNTDSENQAVYKNQNANASKINTALRMFGG